MIVTQIKEDDLDPITRIDMTSFSHSGLAIVFGATGGIGGALVEVLKTSNGFDRVVGLSRVSLPSIDLLDEKSLQRAVDYASELGDLRLVIDATGFLYDENQTPEKNLGQLDASNLARAFALNTIGPALIMKHVLPRLPRTGKSVFATLSARVGSISDNRLGGWYSYRASKAALNQIVRSASIELSRRSPEAFCIALHPGTVATRLSAPFTAASLDVLAPEMAAQSLIKVIDQLPPGASGGFFDWRQQPIPW